MAALCAMFFTLLKAGDHLVASKFVFGNTNSVFGTLADLGVQVTTVDATDAAQVQAAVRPNTRMVYAECPGSLVYEMCDLPALAAMAHARGALVVADNTWGSGCQYRPLALGADVSVMAATKYLSGHSDVMMGTVATTEAEAGWTKTCHDIAHMTLFPKADSWIFGANIPGKTNTVYFYMAGLGAYRQELSAVQNKGYEGFVFQ